MALGAFSRILMDWVLLELWLGLLAFILEFVLDVGRILRLTFVIDVCRAFTLWLAG
jgi:hypothetical protein